MFSFITMNWRGRPLTTLRTIIELISSTTTKTGLNIQAGYNPNWYPTGGRFANKGAGCRPAQTPRVPR